MSNEMDASKLLGELYDLGACQDGVAELEEHLDENRLRLSSASEIWKSLGDDFAPNMRWLLDRVGLAAFPRIPTADGLRDRWAWEVIEPALREKAAEFRKACALADDFMYFLRDEAQVPDFEPNEFDRPDVEEVWDNLDAGGQFRVLHTLKGLGRLDINFRTEFASEICEVHREDSEWMAEYDAHIAALDAVGWAGPLNPEFCQLLGDCEFYIVDASTVEKAWKEEHERRQARGCALSAVIGISGN